jgi:hypothetical protein
MTDDSTPKDAAEPRAGGLPEKLHEGHKGVDFDFLRAETFTGSVPKID